MDNRNGKKYVSVTRLSKLLWLLAIFLLVFYVNCLLWGNNLFGFVPNGDDIGLYEAPKYISELFSKVSITALQSRPLARLLNIIYFPFRFDFNALYLIHLLRFSLVEFLFLLLARQKLSTIYAFLLSIFIFSNPIFYYHIYAIASGGNLTIIGLLIGALYLIERQKYTWVLLLFFLSILTKETFIVMIPITLYSIYKLNPSRRRVVYMSVGILALVLIYFWTKLSTYAPAEDVYGLDISFSKAWNNSIGMFMWLLNLNIYSNRIDFIRLIKMTIKVIEFLVALTFMYFWVIGFLQSFRIDRKWSLVLLATIACALAPFVFLNRIILYYMDLPLIIFGVLLIPVLQKSGRMLIPIFLMFIITSRSLFFTDWINYSFVGISNSVAKNFIRTFQELPVGSKTNVCVINQSSTGWWPTLNGNLVYFLDKNYSGEITSIEKDDLSSCNEGVIMKKVGSEYIRLPNKTY